MSKSLRNAMAFVFSLAIVSGLAVDANGQRRGGFGQVDEFGLLRSPDVQEELELMEDQREEITELEQEMRETMRDMFSRNREDWSGKTNEERREMWSEIQEKLRSQMDEVRPKLNDVLLPEQQKRLGELKFQSQIRRSGGMLNDRGANVLKEQLEITDEQAEQMKQKGEEVRKTLEAKINKLRREAETEVLSVLTEEQRNKYKALMGETFQFSNDTGRNQRGGRGDRQRGQQGRDSDN